MDASFIGLLLVCSSIRLEVKKIVNCAHKPELSDEELDYYSRQIVMAELGFNAQLKLKRSKVCLLGVGGLGSPAAMQLAAMGVGHLRIVDRDVVDSTNLHRQHLYGIDDVGLPKVEAAAKRLRRLNPYIKVEPLTYSVNEHTIKELIHDVDVVVDGLDGMSARYAVNRACVKLGVPYVFGAAITTTGNLSTIVPGETACLECFYGNLDDKKLPKCGVVGVHPSVVNVIASLEVSEAIRILTGREPRLVNKLLYFDLDELEFTEVQLAKVKTCTVCGQRPSKSVVEHELIEEICGRKGKKVFVIVPEENLDVDMVGLKESVVKQGFNLKIEAELGLTFNLEAIKASVLKSGVMILEGVKEKDDALKFFGELLGAP
ncbi:MAG: 4-methyl-5(B-hydroxyethyl)-thiazole monophosphate biosynthesis protein [Candidatus Bathyarchaeum sp.]|nr:MAG: 4-methyl-5(B-hydroxyethyl)-thiazole monophosphate biosynthesis protein [Candidatus Bathyarchaeum sp.]